VKILASLTVMFMFVASAAWLARRATVASARAQTSQREEVNPPPDDPTNARTQTNGAREPLKLPLVEPRVVVSKSARRLELYSEGRVVRTYRVALGSEPVDDKERAGDRRTPEGDFYVCVKNAASKFTLSLGLSYPNREDAARGLRDHLITRAQRDRIVAALERHVRPPWDTALGGEIFIHGGGASSDWTWGCVALDDADIRELFDAVPLGTPVQITH
jgi:hypothetical protein